MITESTIILAIIGMLGLFSTALIYQRANKITSKYYSKQYSHSSHFIMQTSTELSINESVSNIHYFEWGNHLWIELNNGDSVKIEDCDVDRFIMLFRNLLCCKEPPINDDTELKEWSIKQLQEIKDTLNSFTTLTD